MIYYWLGDTRCWEKWYVSSKLPSN